MDNDKLIALIQAVSESNLTSFSMKDGNVRISMDKLDHNNVMMENRSNGMDQTIMWQPAAAPVQTQGVPVISQEIAVPAAAAKTAPVAAPAPSVSDDASVKEVKSPIVGTFYSAPGEGKDDFVKVGDRVKSGQTLCVVEAMKLMNDIESDFDGEVVEILVKNEAMVEFNQPLFRIKVE